MAAPAPAGNCIGCSSCSGIGYCTDHTGYCIGYCTGCCIDYIGRTGRSGCSCCSHGSGCIGPGSSGSGCTDPGSSDTGCTDLEARTIVN